MAEAAGKPVLVMLRDIREAVVGCERQLRDLKAAKYNNLGLIMALATGFHGVDERLSRLEEHLLGEQP